MKRLIGIGLFLILSSVLWGQDGTEADVLEEVPTRSLQFAAFGDDFFEGIKLDVSDEKTISLKFYPDRRSHVFKIPRSLRRLEFYIETLNTDSGRTMRKVVGVSDLYGFGEKALLVFMVNDSEGEDLPYRILSLDESEEVFGPGSIRFLNLSGYPLQAKIAQEFLQLPIEISDTLSFAEDKIEPMPFALAVQTAAGEHTLVYSSGIVPDETRGIVYVIKPPQSAEGRIVSVRRLL